MKWEKVYQQLPSLIGRDLMSISRKSDIRIEDVDDKYLTIRGTNGFSKMPISKLRTVAEALKLKKPLHVETYVHGSGTVRQRPETILANLPDVEWVRIDGRKHIVWVGKKTHPLGTLKPKPE